MAFGRIHKVHINENGDNLKLSFESFHLSFVDCVATVDDVFSLTKMLSIFVRAEAKHFWTIILLPFRYLVRMS